MKLEMDSVCKEISERLKNDYREELINLKMNTKDTGKEHGMEVYSDDPCLPIHDQDWRTITEVGTEEEWNPSITDSKTKLHTAGYISIGDIHAHDMEDESKDGFSKKDLTSLKNVSKITSTFGWRKDRYFLDFMGLVMKPRRHAYDLKLAVAMPDGEIKICWTVLRG